jgi:PAS domain S-box-containing protein
MRARLRAQSPPWLLLLVFVLLSAGIATVGISYYAAQKAAILEEQRNLLAATADLKIGQIEAWRTERLGDARIMRDDALANSQIEEFLDSGAAASHRSDILTWLESRVGVHDYTEAVLVAPDGSVRLASPPTAAWIGPTAQTMVDEVLQTGEAAFSDLHRAGPEAMVHLDLVIPLRVVDGGGPLRTIGILILRIDPSIFLFPLVQSWPTSSPSAETLLVRREGDQVLFLNALRHASDAALTLSFPITRSDLPAAMAVQGETGIVEGIDYRGVPVMAILRPVPNTSWYMIAKIDREEINAPIAGRGYAVGGVVAILILAAAASIGSLWRSQRAEFVRAQFEAELERKVLTEQFGYLSKYANDAILLGDEAGNILEANERAQATYGYSREELLELTLADLRPLETRGALASQLQQVAELGGEVFETLHVRKDGSPFPVEVSARIIAVEGKRRYQGIIRDITERKKAEERILRLNRMYAVLSQTNQAIVRVREKQALLEEVCRIAVQHGKFRMAWIGWLDPETGTVRPVARAGDDGDFLARIRLSAREGPDGQGPIGVAIRSGHCDVCNDLLTDPRTAPRRDEAFAHGYRASAAVPFTEDGEAVGALAVYASEAGFFDQEEIHLLDELGVDISFALDAIRQAAQRQEAVDALQESERKFRETVTHLDEGYYSCTMDGVLIDHNRAFSRMLGFDVSQDLKGAKLPDFWQNPEARKGYVSELTARGVVTNYLINVKAVTGAELVVMANAHLVKDDQGMPVRIEGTFADITKRTQAEEALKRNEALLSEMSRLARIGAWELDVATMKQEWTDETYAIHDRERGVYDPNSTEELSRFEPGSKELIGKAFEEAIEHGRPYDLEVEMTTAKGNRKWVRAVCAAWLKNGKVTKLRGTVQDITERKQAEEALRQSEERYRSTLDNMIEGCQIIGFDWRYLYVNEVAALHGQRSREELVGRTMMEAYPGIETTEMFAALTRCMEERHPEQMDNLFVYPDGTRAWFRLGIQPVPEGTFILSIDISERKRAEEARQAAEARYRALVEQMPAVAYTDSTEQEGVTLYISPQLKIMTGYDPEEWEADNDLWLKIMHPEDRGRVSAEYSHVLETGGPFRSEYRAVARDGRMVWVRDEATLVRDATGRPLFWQGIMLDITERKRAEEEIRGLNESLERKVQERTAQLEAANKELEAFSYSVSHDLRAPLRAIDGFSRIVLEEHAPALAPEAQRYLHLVQDNTQQMGRLVDDLLAFSRLSRQPISKQRLDPTDLVRAALQDLHAEQAGRQIDLLIQDLPACQADPSLLRQVWVNLLSNALKFTRRRERAVIEVGSYEEDTHPVYYVKDNGVGFDMRYVGKLFGVFQRLHKAEEYEGTGVGLAIVQRIVHRHGGRVWAVAKVDQGATFWFTLEGGTGNG